MQIGLRSAYLPQSRKICQPRPVPKEVTAGLTFAYALASPFSFLNIMQEKEVYVYL